MTWIDLKNYDVLLSGQALTWNNVRRIVRDTELHGPLQLPEIIFPTGTRNLPIDVAQKLKQELEAHGVYTTMRDTTTVEIRK
jgi:hypothetical protein